jgi:hypothetical protein
VHSGALPGPIDPRQTITKEREIESGHHRARFCLTSKFFFYRERFNAAARRPSDRGEQEQRTARCRAWALARSHSSFSKSRFLPAAYSVQEECASKDPP